MLEASTFSVTRRLGLREAIRAALASADRLALSTEVIVVASAPEDLGEFDGRVFLVPGVSGYYHQKNVGARHARGEYVVFWDSDCVAEPGYLSRAVALLDRNPKWIGVTGVTRYAGNSWLTTVNSVLSFGYLFADGGYPGRYPALAHNVVLRRLMLTDTPFGEFRARFGGDDYLTQTVCNAGRLLPLDRQLVVNHEDPSFSLTALLERHLREHFGRRDALNLSRARLLAHAWRSVFRSVGRRRRKLNRYGRFLTRKIAAGPAETTVLFAYALADAAAVAILTIAPSLLDRWLAYQYGAAS